MTDLDYHIARVLLLLHAMTPRSGRPRDADGDLMTTTVRINEVMLTTSANRHSYAFGDGVNVIVGPVGAGKTSLLELLRFGIGGNGVLSQAAEEAVQRVTVTAR